MAVAEVAVSRWPTGRRFPTAPRCPTAHRCPTARLGQGGCSLRLARRPCRGEARRLRTARVPRGLAGASCPRRGQSASRRWPSQRSAVTRTVGVSCGAAAEGQRAATRRRPGCRRHRCPTARGRTCSKSCARLRARPALRPRRPAQRPGYRASERWPGRRRGSRLHGRHMYTYRVQLLDVGRWGADTETRNRGLHVRVQYTAVLYCVQDV